MNKSLLTNLIALSVTIYGLLSPVFSAEIFMAGLFGLSGSLTNWIAIHMIFEKVPLLYGSGVIQDRFLDFKEGIKNLIMHEFFSKDSLEKFIKNQEQIKSQFIPEIEHEKVYEKLVEAIEESSLGPMLPMIGGKEALEPLKGPVKKKISELIDSISSESESISSSNFQEKIENIINERLEELTPEQVKIIIKDIIHKHLGWLVVWGGVFGFTIGLILGFLGS